MSLVSADLQGKKVNFEGMIAELRTMRPLMVQTLEQYRFCHEVALLLVE